MLRLATLLLALALPACARRDVAATAHAVDAAAPLLALIPEVGPACVIAARAACAAAAAWASWPDGPGLPAK